MEVLGEKLPAELVLLIREEAVLSSSFAELVSLSLRSHASWKLVSRLFPAWIRSQPVGVPLSPFCGTREKTFFLVEHVEGEFPLSSGLPARGLSTCSAG